MQIDPYRCSREQLRIHGKIDKVVPLAENSAMVQQRYQEAGARDLVTLDAIDGQGHNFWSGFFRCQELIDFAIEKAIAGAK